MEIRSVSVHLDAEVAAYIAKMKLAGAETEKAFSSLDKDRLGTLNRQLTGTATRLDKVAVSASKVSTEGRKAGDELGQFGSKVENTRTRVDNGSKSIDKYSGRLSLLVSGLAAVGPAAIPITAVALPAVTALGSGLGFAAVGFGAVKLASLGAKDALTALNKAELEPTVENLQAADLAMSQLPPDVRAFVLELQRLRPEVTRLQDAAAAGLFPGVDAGLRAASRDLPLAERAIGNVSSKLGSLSRQAGQSLGSSQWRPFLRFVGTEAPHELGVLGHATGDVSHGLAELWMALSPLNRDADRGVLRLAQDFDQWATALDKTRDYQSFLLYVQTNGPRVVELLGDTAQLFVDIVQAAAPLGGPTLQALDLIVKVLDAIANSPVATPLLALGQISAILKLTSRGLAGLGLNARVGFGGIESGARTSTTAVRGLRSELTLAARAARTIGGNAKRYTTSGTTLMAGVSSEEKAGLGKSAALGAGLVLATSGVDQKIGLTNTATLALAGSMAGPLGTAIGGAVGGFLDLQNELDAEKLATQAFGNQIDDLVQGNRVAKLQQLSDGLHGLKDQPGGAGIAGDLVDQMIGKVDPALDRTKRRVDNLSDAQRLNAAAAGDFGHAQQVAARRTLALQQAADQTAQSFLGLGEDVDNTKVSLKRWIVQLGHEAQALTEFGNNAARAADKGLRKGLIDALEKAGPAGALRMRQLANATQSEIAKANRAWGAGKRATEDYQQAAAYVSQHPAQVYVKGVPQSLEALQTVASELRSLHDRTLRITTVHVTGGRSLPGMAAGGTIPGARYPYGDKVLTPTAPGEEVISNSHGQADMNRGPLKAANRGARLAVIDGPGMAAGGTAGRIDQVSTRLVSQSSSRHTERIVERLPRTMRLGVDAEGLYAELDGLAQDNYESNQDFERRQAGG